MMSCTDKCSCIAAETFGFPNHPWLVNSNRIISHVCTQPQRFLCIIQDYNEAEVKEMPSERKLAMATTG